jgi:hypothetical protein
MFSFDLLGISFQTFIFCISFYNIILILCLWLKSLQVNLF